MPTFTEAVDQLTRNKNNYVDFKAYRKDIKVLNQGSKIEIKGKEYPVNSTGLATLCKALKMPKKYFKDYYPVHTEFSEHANTLLQTKPEEELLIRTFGDMVRAVLTPSYRIFDDSDIMDALSKQISQQENVSFNVYRSNAEQVTYVIAFGKELNVDSVYPMIRITNSEVGLSDLVVEFGLYRVVCTNMMTVPEKNYGYFKWNHGDRGFNKVKGCVQMAFDRGNETWVALNDQLEIARSHHFVPEAITNIILRLEEENVISGRFAKRVKEDIMAVMPATPFDLINVFTRLAQKEKSLKSQAKYEHLATQMLLGKHL